MPRQHIDPLSRELRQRCRARIGSLQHSRVASKTQERYRAALRAFEVWTGLVGRSFIGTTEELDVTTTSYIEALWTEGESRGQVGDLLSALQWALQRRRILSGSWELFRTWSLLELPVRAPPLPAIVCCALAGLALEYSQLGLAAVLLSAFDGMLRTTEYLTLSAGQCVASNGQVLVLLPLTKSGQRHGGAESVVVADPQAASLLSYVCNAPYYRRRPQAPLVDMKPQAFRKWLRQACAMLGVSELKLMPYSFRRGGATLKYTQGMPIRELLLLGRWESSRTARIYITEAALILQNASLSDDVRATLQKYVRVLVDFLHQHGL